MPDDRLTNKYYIGVCGTEVPPGVISDITEGGESLDGTPWFSSHIRGCARCFGDTKESLRQRIASLEGMNATLTGSIKAFRDSCNARRNLLSEAKSLLSKASIPDADVERAHSWHVRTDRELDLNRF